MFVAFVAPNHRNVEPNHIIADSEKARSWFMGVGRADVHSCSFFGQVNQSHSLRSSSAAPHNRDNG